MSFPFLYILNSLHLLLLFTCCQVCLPVKETAEIETGMAKKSSWDQANIWQKLGLVWINRKKISQIIKDYFYLPFFLLNISWADRLQKEVYVNWFCTNSKGVIAEYTEYQAFSPVVRISSAPPPNPQASAAPQGSKGPGGTH
jgi:hypothetical protein